LQHLAKAEKLGPRNEYVCHKIAQVYLKKGDADEALRRYGSIQPHKQVPYILRGIAQCLLAKGQALEAAKKLHQAIRREPDKFFHYKDFALALIELQASDQAVEALEKTNSLYENEHGKPYKWAIDKINAIRSSPLSSAERINFDQDQSSVSTISFGAVTKFNDDRGFGFIQDRSDNVTVFFHISRVKDRATPQTGAKVRYVREAGQKGPQASRVWLLKD
jgi:cold shock CspA family protein